MTAMVDLVVHRPGSARWVEQPEHSVARSLVVETVARAVPLELMIVMVVVEAFLGVAHLARPDVELMD